MDRDTAHTGVLRECLASARMINPVFEAASAGRALHYLHGRGKYADRTVHPLPILVVTAFDLEEPDGRVVLEAIRDTRALRMTPVLTIGTTAEDAEVLEAHRLGATAYLARSLASRVIVDVIRGLSVSWCLVPAQVGS